MKRFIQPLLSLALLLVAGTALAQPVRYVEGTHYDLIAKPVRTADPNKVEVTEVFWYGCPHCYAFEPLLESWVEKLPADVAFVRSPGMWNAMMQTHAKIFYVEQALGSFDKTHKLVFDTIQQQRNPLTTQDAVRAVFVTKGISPEDFDKAWNSFGVTSGVKQAEARMKDYGVNGVPNIIVNGKYRVGNNDAVTSHAQLLQVVDFLIGKEREAKGKR